MDGIRLRQAIRFFAAALVVGWSSSSVASPDQTPNAVGASVPTPTPRSTAATVDATAASDWSAICLSNRDDLQQGVQMAVAAGWMVAPDNLMPPLKGVIGKPQLWLRSSASGIKFLLIGRMSNSLRDGGPEFIGRFCAIAITPAEADVVQEAAALVRVPPNPSGTKLNHVTYLYRHTPQGLSPILGDLKDPATVQAIQSPDVDIVLVGGRPKMSIILLVIPDGR